MSHVRVLYFIMKKCLKTKNSQLDRTAETPWCVFYAEKRGKKHGECKQANYLPEMWQKSRYI